MAIFMKMIIKAIKLHADRNNLQYPFNNTVQKDAKIVS
jgi:hypothetical protein